MWSKESMHNLIVTRFVRSFADKLISKFYVYAGLGGIAIVIFSTTNSESPYPNVCGNKELQIESVNGTSNTTVSRALTCLIL